jgi:hypothetical protein
MRYVALLSASLVVAGCGGATATKTVNAPSATSQAPSTATSSAGGNSQQQQLGITVGQDFVRVTQAFMRRPGTVPTLVALVSLFNAWISGNAHGKDISQDVTAAGFSSDPAPETPLSPEAGRAAAAVAIPYLGRASSSKYGSVDGGYVLGFHNQKLEFRCKARGNPPTDQCKGPSWSAWQSGFR